MPGTIQLTERQQSVMELIDRRVPIKLIAQELSVSETRINQHIRALKNIYNAGSMKELVETYRSSQGIDFNSLDNFVEAENTMPLAAEGGTISNKGPQDEALQNASGQPEPQILPEVLDGNNAVGLRLIVIVAIFIAILTSITLVLSTGIVMDEALKSRVKITEIEVKQSLTTKIADYKLENKSYSNLALM